MTDSRIRPIGAGRQLPFILIVDDDPRIRQVIRDVLTEEGFTVATAADGPQAIRRAADQPPALVVLDMGLPRMDGYEVAAALRAAHGRALPILTITADGGAADKARRVGAFAYLRKPFDLDDLVAAVRGGLRAD
jgi:DNA-binding response OmpR family regulator